MSTTQKNTEWFISGVCHSDFRYVNGAIRGMILKNRDSFIPIIIDYAEILFRRENPDDWSVQEAWMVPVGDPGYEESKLYGLLGYKTGLFYCS